MKHPERVEDYLEHIAQAIDRVAGYLQPVPDLEGRQAPDFIKQHPEVPWAQMRGMRNIAIHEYFFVDLGIVWTTVRNDFPKLRQKIDTLLKR